MPEVKWEYIREPLSKEKVYGVFLHQLEQIEKSTIFNNDEERRTAEDNSIDIGFKLFPIIESIASNIVGKSTRGYFEALGYTETESNLMYSLFRNGLLHNFIPHIFEYEDGNITWGLMSSSGNSGFIPYSPGYKSEDPEFSSEADKAIICDRVNINTIHVSLAWDTLVAHIKYDIQERLKEEKREKIDMIVGMRFKGKMPSDLHKL